MRKTVTKKNHHMSSSQLRDDQIPEDSPMRGPVDVYILAKHVSPAGDGSPTWPKMLSASPKRSANGAGSRVPLFSSSYVGGGTYFL
jgi:hypothetical protein